MLLLCLRFRDDDGDSPNNDVYTPDRFGVPDVAAAVLVVVDDEAVELRVSDCSVPSPSLESDSLMYIGSGSLRRTNERGEL